MRVVVQRVSRAEVRVGGMKVGEIGRGLLGLVGVLKGDDAEDIEWMARKLVGLRVFADEDGKMNRSVREVEGKILLVSQFTLSADMDRGMRPSFSKAMAPEGASTMFELFVTKVRESVEVETGVFGANMEVELVGDGPVTIWIDSKRGPA